MPEPSLGLESKHSSGPDWLQTFLLDYIVSKLQLLNLYPQLNQTFFMSEIYGFVSNIYLFLFIKANCYWRPFVVDWGGPRPGPAAQPVSLYTPNFVILGGLRMLCRCYWHATNIIYHHSKAETMSILTVHSQLLQKYFSLEKIYIL